jgi:myo-inositol 2-dehydrogenase / D-chiro-inositol 1-dehydrogenase
METVPSDPAREPGSTARFRLGVVGAGRMGRTHVAALKDSTHVAVVAAVDPRAEVREELGQQGLATYAGVDALLETAGIDGVLVAAPSTLHRDLIERFAAARVPVLCEKPCGVTSDEAEKSVAIAESAGIPLQVAYWRRYVPELRQLRELLRQGELGEILAVHSLQWDEAPPSDGFREQSGGIFVDMGVHEFDQIRWLTGQDLGNVQSVSSRRGAGAGMARDPDSAEVICELSGGGTGLVSLGRWHPEGDTCRVDVFGTAGTRSCWFLRPSTGDEVFRQGLRHQAEDFARLVAGGEGEGATASDAVAALRAAEQARSGIGASVASGAGR